jgi:hypothetical protein
MGRIVRLTLMWLLAVALPLQGVSAATMLACDAGQHGRGNSKVPSHSHIGHIAAEHGHSHVADASLHEHTGVAPPGNAKLAKDVAHRCSACASCCLNAVAPTETVSFETIKLPDLFAPLVARTVAAYVTEGVERPPRFFLA